VRANGLQAVVVILPVLLEIQRQVQHGFVQGFFRAQQQRDQQPAQAAVAIREWMYGLELHMGQCRLDQYRTLAGLVEMPAAESRLKPDGVWIAPGFR